MHLQHGSVVSTDENDGTVVEIIKNNNDDNVDVTTYDDFLADHHPILKDLLGRHLLSGKRSPKDDCFFWAKVHYICFTIVIVMDWIYNLCRNPLSQVAPPPQD